MLLGMWTPCCNTPVNSGGKRQDTPAQVLLLKVEALVGRWRLLPAAPELSEYRVLTDDSALSRDYLRLKGKTSEVVSVVSHSLVLVLP